MARLHCEKATAQRSRAGLVSSKRNADDESSEICPNTGLVKKYDKYFPQVINVTFNVSST
jgi:hypothetical protein